MRVAHLQIIAEHIVIRYLQAGYARTLHLPLLDVQQVILALVSDMPQFVQFGVHPFGNHPALVHHKRRVVLYLAGDAVADGGAEVQLLPYPPERLVRGMFARPFDGLDGLQGRAELHHITRGHPPHRHLGDDTLQVAHQVQLLPYQLTELRFTEEIIHHVQPLIDGFLVLQRKKQPTPHQTGPHRRDGVVYHVQERLPPFRQRVQQLQVAHGEFIQTHITLLLYPGDGCDMPRLRVLGHVQILQDGTGGHNAALQMVDAESLKVFYLKMLQELFHCRAFGEDPVVQLESKELGAEISLEQVALPTLEKHFLRGKVAQKLVHIFHAALGRKELSRTDVQKSHAAGFHSEMHG